jgi:hypothetical protein
MQYTLMVLRIVIGQHLKLLYADGSKDGDRVALAAVLY